ncbi:ATP-binding cassette domain-containing protein [Sphingobacterium olei]|uniref:ATP-binding cassette domain-containing protein n=1 Tax=Sphingobacterium olei TaxID=2571155 RepID=A0A4U0P0D3_9SPHI|nr:ATP-binding cassette domain-containing protein [Sphingobacterium olei]TJZ60480.1 ATP-binding cassette domain-containing protein [Sphingobacterium olei]
MNITLLDIGRRYNQEWIFRHIDYTFSSSKKYAILGPNGAGKSTLIKVLSGNLTSSEGKIAFEKDGQDIDVENIYTDLTIAAPYVELIEEFTLNELLDFHFKFKSYYKGFTKESIISLLMMEKAVDKEIRHFSSGMKQRVKLVLACCSDSDIVLLDEPMSNMDVQGENWYGDLLEKTMSTDRLLIIGSNQKKEYHFCDEFISIVDYK